MSTTNNSTVETRNQLISQSKSKACKIAHKHCVNFFLQFAVEELKVDSRHPSLIDTIRTSKLHSDFVTDDIMSRFLAFMFKHIKSKPMKLKCNIRPFHSWLSVSCTAAVGKDIKQFAETEGTWSGIKKDEDWITDDPEQCIPLTEDDIDKIMGMSVYNKLGDIDLEIILRKLLCGIKLAGSIRGINSYDLEDDGVYVSQGTINGQHYDKPILCFKTYQQKHQVGEVLHGTQCSCDGDHIPLNYSCLITLFNEYRRLINESEEFIQKFTSTKPNPIKDGKYFFRHLKYKANKYQPKNGEKINKYYSRQRMGQKRMDNNLNWFNEKLNLSIKSGTNPFATKNRKHQNKFARHTERRTKIRLTEINHGHLLSDQEKLSITSHKNIKTWHSYADRGHIQKERTIRKLSNLEAEHRRNRNNKSIASSLPPPPPIPQFNLPKFDIPSRASYIGSSLNTDNMKYYALPNIGPNGQSTDYDITGSLRSYGGSKSNGVAAVNSRYKPY